MLTSDDRRLAAHDRSLPGLATMLDPEALKALLSDYVTPAGGVRVEYLRYKPGTSLTCGLLLDTPIGVVRAYGVAGSAEFAAKLPRLTGLQRPGLNRPLAADLRTHVVVSSMESDPALRSLRSGMRGLRRTMPEVAEGRVRVLRYRPLRRAVVLVEAAGAPTAVVRVVDPKEVDGHLRRLRTAIDERLPVPREIRHSRRRGVIASAYVGGAVSDNGVLDRDTQALSGAVLAGWHARSGGFRLPEADPVSTLRSTAGLVGDLVPDLADQAASVARSISGGLHAAASPRHRLVHGDFSVDQVVRTPASVTVLDIDRLRPDAPEWDVATWFATEMLAGNAPLDAEPEEVMAPLLEAYRAAGGADLRRDLRLYAAAALLLRAAEPFRLRQPSWAHRVADVVRAAGTLAAVPA